VPKKYLLLLDRTICLHFRSSIDRPLNPLPPYPCSNNYFSIPKENTVTAFVAEIGVPREIHRPVASHWQTLLHNVLSSTPRHEWGSNEGWFKRMELIEVKSLIWAQKEKLYIIYENVMWIQWPTIPVWWQKKRYCLILMEFMIITVYKLSFHINQWKKLVCWK
jgi:hypothetical protein